MKQRIANMSHSLQQDPAVTVAISPIFNLTSLCQTWVVISRPGNGSDLLNAEGGSLRVSVTGACPTCAQSDLCESFFFFLYFFFFSNGENEILTEEEGADEYFCIALGSDWWYALLLNSSDNGVAPQPEPANFGIQWYVLPII